MVSSQFKLANFFPFQYSKLFFSIKFHKQFFIINFGALQNERRLKSVTRTEKYLWHRQGSSLDPMACPHARLFI